MEQPPLLSKKHVKKRTQSKSTSSIIIKSILATALLVSGVIVGGSYISGGIGWILPSQQGDNLTNTQIQERLATFNSIGTVPLLSVSDEDFDKAINSMQLPSTEKKIILTQFAKHQTQSQMPTSPHSAAELPSKHIPSTQTIPEKNQLHLAWISLWDTDVEDGDVVRIDSQGYTRTLLLKNQPITFAIPIPADGVVQVTGVSDGDGGGITVGLASGTSRAVFPIMSPGQHLGLKVRIN